MGNKKKRRARKKPTPTPKAVPAPKAPDDLARQADEAMGNGRFRKARDLFKQLAKSDPDSYLPRLVEANLALAKQMLEKGKATEADQVFAYVRKIAPKGISPSLNLEIALAQDDWDTAAAAATALLCEPPQDADRALRKAVDVLVAMGRPLPDQGDTPEKNIRLALDAVLAALEAISEQRFDHALELLRPVGRSGPLAGWKVLLKGMIAFYGGDLPKALRLFEESPAGGPAGVASAFLPLCGSPLPPGSAKDPARTAAICRLAHPDAATPIARSDSLWRAGRHGASYQALRDAIADFPTEEPNLLGDLTRFFSNAFSDLDSRAFYAYVETFERYYERRKEKNNLEARIACRLMAEFYVSDDDCIRTSWERYVEFYESAHGPNPRLASMVDCHLGVQFAEEEPDPFFGNPGPRNPDWAIELFQRSIERDHTNLKAHFALMDVFEQCKKVSQLNALLDKMTARFPNEKKVLFLAGARGIERKAFKKGIAYLDRAHALDPLDCYVARSLIIGHLRMAAAFYRKDKPERGREAFARLASLNLQAAAADIDQRPEFIRARQSFWERFCGDPNLADAHEREAFASPHSEAPVAFYFARLYTDSADPALTKLYRDRFDAATHQTPPPSVVVAIVQIYCLIRNRLNETDKPLSWETKAVVRCVRASVKKPLPRQDAIAIMDALGPDPDTRLANKAVVDSMLKIDRDDPHFGFFRFADGLRHPSLPSPQDITRLEALEAEAHRRNDQAALSLINPTLTAARRRLKMFDADGFFAGDYFDEEDEDLDDHFDDHFDVDVVDDEDVDDEDDDENFDEDELMRQQLAGMSDAQFREFRKIFEGVDRGAVIDRLRDEARQPTPNRKPPQKSAPKSVPRSRPSPTNPGSDQPELF
ncbi:hypothetical protein BH23VER1_BH23VER1_05510 [soil metagenome]